MTIFLRLLLDHDKAASLLAGCTRFRRGEDEARLFRVAPEAFAKVPGAPFAYWVSAEMLSAFTKYDSFEKSSITRRGMSTLDDFRFIRCRWEVAPESYAVEWVPYSKGEENVPFYDSLYSVAKWASNGREVKAYVEQKVGSASRTVQSQELYFRSGLTWVRRTFKLCVRALPEGCIFSGGAQAIFPTGDALSTLGITRSSAFDFLTKLSAGRTGDAVQFEPGMLAKVPTPHIGAEQQLQLRDLARRAWSLTRFLSSVEETSSAYELPAQLRLPGRNFDPFAIAEELARTQVEIDAIVFEAYGFGQADRSAVMADQFIASQSVGERDNGGGGDEGHGDEPPIEDPSPPIDHTEGIVSWAIGVAFGRFDWRLATGERVAPPEPGPFDQVPAKSPGMLPDGAAPFHGHNGILVDDPGHPHDLVRLTEEVLARVEATAPVNLRRWIQRDFFPVHLQRYSKSRRRAPIYWPLSTVSGSYTLWLYYPSISSQTLYTAINDFVEPKLREVGGAVAALRIRASDRTRDEEKAFEMLQAFELELIELRDSLLSLAPGYKPSLDDGVQIGASPLWSLFRYKPWQKVLKETWAKLDKGDYDWARLAMSYFPGRILEKCKTDKPLAIAHGLEHLYIEPEARPKKSRERKKAGGAE